MIDAPLRKLRRAKAPTTPDPIEIAMAAEARDTATNSPARQVLLEQVRLIRAQRRSENFGATLKVLTGAAGLAAAAFLGVMVWNASRADGLVIEPFSAPASLAERGITGEALARGLMDRLSVISATARSAEEQRRVSSDLGQGVSIQIPETGVSLSQIETWLKSKLGHERRVSGEVIVRDDATLRLIIRSGADPLPDQFGEASDLPALLQKAAETLYAREQPDSYFSYLQLQARWADMAAFARTRIALRSRTEKAKGYAMLGNALRETEGSLAARAAYLRSLAIDPEASGVARGNLGSIEGPLGHPEASYRIAVGSLARLRRQGTREGSSREALQQRLWSVEQVLAAARCDFGRALDINTRFSQADLLGFVASVAPLTNVAANHGDLHDIRRAWAVLDSFEPANHGDLHDIRRAWAVLDSFEPDNPAQVGSARNAETQIAIASEDWPRALAILEGNIANLATLPDKGVTRFSPRARLASVLIRLGRLEEAGAELDATPLDCQPCVMARGALAEAKGDPRTADHWFGEAVKMTPSLPRASYEWGAALLARGEAGRAIVQFQVANARGPNWADPLVSWGEALLAKGDAKGAAARFRQAEKHAPNWGRLQLLWGEALAKSGRPDQAQARWAKAKAMFLTPTEQARLAADLKGAGA